MSAPTVAIPITANGATTDVKRSESSPRATIETAIPPTREAAVMAHPAQAILDAVRDGRPAGTPAALVLIAMA
jgi:uncharacterized protein GlcG (DUF336 family)